MGPRWPRGPAYPHCQSEAWEHLHTKFTSWPSVSLDSKNSARDANCRARRLADGSTRVGVSGATLEVRGAFPTSDFPVHLVSFVGRGFLLCCRKTHRVVPWNQENGLLPNRKEKLFRVYFGSNLVLTSGLEMVRGEGFWLWRSWLLDAFRLYTFCNVFPYHIIRTYC